ncbi:phospholipase D-like domain-containing protein [Derxia lacustris]|uniref:phospholipase D-like domain-containing protein n=1 Tax=Derxia lacustris TaxID=764842 RepID=UPI000A173D93|nr:phospholipase D-like domain-containing protein [Derxia lacustris]
MTPARLAPAPPLLLAGNTVRLLTGFDELGPALHAACDAARHDIQFETYIFHDDPSAQALLDCLGRAAARGVKVRLLVDGFGSAHTLGWLIGRCRALGVGLLVYRPFSAWRTLFHPKGLRRLHRKLCVVDGELLFCGGINVIDDRLDIHHGRFELPRLDYAVEVRGPVAARALGVMQTTWLRTALRRDWRRQVRDLAVSPEPWRDLRTLWRGLRARGELPADTDRLAPRPGERGPADGEAALAGIAPAPDRGIAADTPSGTGDGPGAPGIPRASAAPRVALVMRDNLLNRRAIERVYLDAIGAARERVLIVTPYFYPSRQLRQALVGAARRGVRVALLLQGRYDYRIAAWAARALYRELLDAGVRIREYTPTFLHAKVACVDADWATVGSSNIDPLSLLYAREANVVVAGREFNAELAASVEAAMARAVPVLQAPSGVAARLAHRAVALVARLVIGLAGQIGRRY